jgi:arylsulfatase A-like enzyme
LKLSPDSSAARSNGSRASLSTLLAIAICFGVTTGCVEGFALLLFQRINWARWGATIHVSWPILWISILVDVALFALLALLFGAIARFASKIQTVHFVSLLVFLAAYDWLSVTGRLRVTSSTLLAVGVAAVFTRWARGRERTVVDFSKRTAPLLAAFGVLVFVIVAGGQWFTERAALQKLPAASAEAPNVLVIVVDTLRADHLSAYGYSRPTSPDIDRVASQGTLFENAVAAASWSLPSHASMLTGRYQFEHGVGDIDGTPIRDSKIPALGGFASLGEALAKRGYRTGAFSANRSYFTANLGFGRGFQHFEDYFHSSSDSFVRTLFGGELAGLYLNAIRNVTLAHALRSMGCEALMDANFERAGGLGGAHVRKRASTVNDEVLRWVDSPAQAHPFFAVLNYFDVHNPYGGPPNYAKPSWDQGGSLDQYDASVKYIDDSVGSLMASLAERGLTGKMLVIITSDHGESLGQHGLAYHGHSLYRELIHVPLIFWYPGHVPSGMRVSAAVTNAAIPVTVMDILGSDAASSFPGQALDAFWKPSGDPIASTAELSELAEEHFLEPEDEGAEKRIPIGTTGAMKSMFGQQWHLIIHKKFGNQLYDWVHDPSESKNLIHTPEGAEVSAKLMSGLQDSLAQIGLSSDKKAAAIPLNLRGAPRLASVVQQQFLKSMVNNYYSFQAEPGEVVTINVKREGRSVATAMDPVVTVTDAEGQPLTNCRDPEDDQAQGPAEADPTPESFDDICINDDISPGVQSASQLQILIPGTGNSPVELYVRVSDWSGRAKPGTTYQIAIMGASVKAARR